MEENLKKLKELFEDLKIAQYNPEYIKALEESIKRIEETMSLDTIKLDNIEY